MALKYRTILTQLQMKIISGEWSEGFKMPTEMELCKQYGVSRITVRKALESLVTHGYVSRTRGRGSFVLFNREVVSIGQTNDDSLLKGQYHILLKEKLFPTAFDKEQLALEDQLWHVRSLHVVDDKPTVLSDYYITSRFEEPIITMQDRCDESIFEIIGNHSGQRCSFVKGKIAAISPNEEICKHLQLDPQSANLWCRGMCVLEDGTVVGRCTKVFDGMVYEFAFDPPNGSQPIANPMM